ncbi:energy transducer TonB [Agrobacterium rhizogenes]|uniref:Membrane protein n=1 Tax=Rhizobium rhizogenes (strain K84 / ATCC BAA-868) TaxID=311403 RepID=B9J861_RHIR8|nr:TonB family protein [Rhizobium rhizogenes]ACM27382.1 membrane protein [Rhizobium rhizogenes K84]KAA6484746.1 energy transducer TonB [Agrobacterium sp. ICMP 7243]NTF49353.1 energy transducer TonB [Rhizobium rhizogenes]NTF62355.1 energy transducer TonB [Rhizobium rhizogenes]NTG01242.1 energy transducer TonB [Rhizobium rhizogenes]
MARRSAQVSIDRHRSGDGLNDNYPSVLPGHELAGLDGLPRPPTAEAVSHYSRFTQIGSYPAHPTEPAPDASEPPVMDMLSAEKPSHVLSAGKKGVTFAYIGSCLFHLAVVAVLLFAVVPPENVDDDQAGDTLSVVMIGNGDADAKAEGDEIKQPPEPEQVTAQAVQPETVQSIAAEPVEAEAAQPVEAPEAVVPTPETVQQLSPETVVTSEPEILATQAPAESTVVQPANAEPVEVQPTEITQAAEPPAEVVTPVDKPVQQRPKPVDKPKEIKKQPQKVVKLKSGSNGDALENSTRGSSEGTENAQSDNNSQSNARRTGSGSAAMESYKGKVRSCIQRAIRRISPSERNLTVTMRFRVDASGQVLSPAIAGGSGNSQVDQAVLAALRGVGSCPAIPSEMGVSSMPFFIPIQVR